METKGNGKRREDATDRSRGDAPGIIITDGGVGSRQVGQHPRVWAFVYGEDIPSIPTLPFGRWKVAS